MGINKPSARHMFAQDRTEDAAIVKVKIEQQKLLEDLAHMSISRVNTDWVEL